jgi:hypothetical protein
VHDHEAAHTRPRFALEDHPGHGVCRDLLGVFPTGIHIGLLAYDPVHLALLRFLLASVFMVVVALCIRLPGLRDVPHCCSGWVSLRSACITWRSTSASKASAPALPVCWHKPRRCSAPCVARRVQGPGQPLALGCVLLGLLGVVIVVAGDRGLGSIDAHGLLILLAALSWSLYFALQKHHTGRYDWLTLVCYTVWSGTLLLLVFLPGLVEQVAWRRCACSWRCCPGDIPQCLGVFGLGLCAGTWI